LSLVRFVSSIRVCFVLIREVERVEFPLNTDQGDL